MVGIWGFPKLRGAILGLLGVPTIRTIVFWACIWFPYIYIWKLPYQPWSTIGVIKGDTRSLDYSSYG